QEDINELKANDPTGFTQLDNLKDVSGNAVDVYIGRTDTYSNGNGGTEFSYNTAESIIYTSETRGGAATRPNSVTTWVMNSPADGKSQPQIISHEIGHILDMAANPAAYWANRSNWTSMNCQVDVTNPYAIPALNSENAYNALPKTYVRKTYIKPTH
ncbi:MAG: hypothetical protein ACOYLO_12720, partial [Ferruginibacter sp.]